MEKRMRLDRAEELVERQAEFDLAEGAKHGHLKQRDRAYGHRFAASHGFTQDSQLFSRKLPRFCEPANQDMSI